MGGAGLQACGKGVAEAGFSRWGTVQVETAVGDVPQRLKPRSFKKLDRRPEGLLHPLGLELDLVSSEPLGASKQIQPHFSPCLRVSVVGAHPAHSMCVSTRKTL